MGEQCIILNENEYLLMGDNWGNSTDCLTGGPTEENDIIGRVDIIIHYGENQFRTLVNKMWNLIFKEKYEFNQTELDQNRCKRICLLS